jgi:methyltransferase (TIGR00027 family)
MSKGAEQKPSRTAMATALFRAIANKEFINNKFGSDNFAEYFLPFPLRFLIKTKRSRTRIVQKAPSGVYEFFIARTQYFDHLFTDALSKPIPQIVLLGAGYDTRAYRFGKQNDNTRIFELDIGTTQGRKIDLLKKAKIILPGNVEFVSIDFNKDSLEEVLSKAGFDMYKYTLYLWEGVTYYLEPDSINTTLESIKRISNKGSAIAFDYLVKVPPEETHKYYGLKELLEFMAKSYPNDRNKFFLKEGEIEPFLKLRGFFVDEHLNNTDIEKKFLTDDSNLLIGHIVEALRFALASTVSDVRKTAVHPNNC